MISFLFYCSNLQTALVKFANCIWMMIVIVTLIYRYVQMNLCTERAYTLLHAFMRPIYQFSLLLPKILLAHFVTSVRYNVKIIRRMI